jgi:hypothetical protein
MTLCAALLDFKIKTCSSTTLDFPVIIDGQFANMGHVCLLVHTGGSQPPVQWVPGVLSPGVKRGRGVTQTTHPI